MLFILQVLKAYIWKSPMTYDEAFEVAHCPETREAINKLREKYIRYPITKSLTAEDAFMDIHLSILKSVGSKSIHGKVLAQ
jgi:hypothetical protein